MSQRLIVTGTDTGVGKTFLSEYLLHQAAAQGMSTLGLKPIAAGAYRSEKTWVNEDALRLMAAATESRPYQAINPFCFKDAIAPHIAASLSDDTLTAKRITQKIHEVDTANVDFVVLEGCGGWRVPLNLHETFADIAVALKWPVLLVVGVRLGCLNHALLTLSSIEAAGCACIGWVANQIDVEMPNQDENVKTLECMLDVPFLGLMPWQSEPTDKGTTANLRLEAIWASKNMYPSL